MRLADEVRAFAVEKGVVIVVDRDGDMPAEILIGHALATKSRHESLQLLAVTSESKLCSRPFNQVFLSHDPRSAHGLTLLSFARKKIANRGAEPGADTSEFSLNRLLTDVVDSLLCGEPPIGKNI